MKRLANWFVRGLVVVVPIVATVWLLTDLFSWIDNLVVEAVDHLFKIRRPGIGFALAVVAITTIGWLASFLLGRWLERVTDWVLSRIPLVRTIYGTLKDILQAVGGEKKTFDNPVVVTLFPGGTAKVLGFVTRSDLSEIGLPGDVAVLMQQSLNFAGNILIFPKAQVRPLAVDSGKFMTFVMSGGLTGDLKPGKEESPAFPTLHDAG